MKGEGAWVTDATAALLTDLYELRMLAAYHAEGVTGRATFSLYFRRLPPGRSWMLAAGLDDALRFLETLRFRDEDLAWLGREHGFDDGFLRALAALRFTGDAWAVPEGTPVFPEEPLLEVEAPVMEAQLAESFVMNQVHLQTVLATKAARVRLAAAGRAVVDFGLRRMHGTDAAMKGARAYWIAGLDATSNVLAGHVYGVPISGTMAHSYVEAHDDELEAFRAYAARFPDTVLLVDTYDTLEGVRKVVRLAEELGDAFAVRGVRLDSGDLGALARGAREILDAAGLTGVRIVASGGLDEHGIARLVREGAPIDAFGVGTAMGVSEDAPTVDLAYKLTAYAGEGRLKLSAGKRILPGRKQVFRREEGGVPVGDTLAREGEALEGRPLLRQVMAGGRRTEAGREPLDAARARAAEALARLPARYKGLEAADPPYPVAVSDALRAHEEDVRRRVLARVAP